MAKKSLRVMLAHVVIFATLSVQGAPPSEPLPQGREPAGKLPGKSSDAEPDISARLDFAPMWMPIPRFPPESESDTTVQVPSAAYSVIWQKEWQEEIGLSAEQKEKLSAINAKALPEIKRREDQFKKLSPEEQKAQIEALDAKPSPGRQDFDDTVRKQIETVLTPRQLQAIKNHSLPRYMIGLIYDAPTRAKIGFDAMQQDRFRRVVRERLERLQEEYLKQADEVWGLLTLRQQAELPALVESQGPTSAVLSIGYHLGFDLDAMGLSYPMLAEPPVRKRLKLNAHQEKQLQTAMIDAASRTRKRLQRASEAQAPTDDDDDDDNDKERLEAILTPQQLAMLKEIDFRRQVVLALGYPEKKKSIDITPQQTAALKQLDKQTHAKRYQIDNEMLEKALQVLTAPQREQLSATIESELGG